MLQRLILENIIVSAMIMKLDQARKCKKNMNKHEISVKHVALPRVSGTAYKFALYPLIDAEIYSTINSNNYTVQSNIVLLKCFFLKVIRWPSFISIIKKTFFVAVKYDVHVNDDIQYKR